MMLQSQNWSHYTFVLDIFFPRLVFFSRFDALIHQLPSQRAVEHIPAVVGEGGEIAVGGASVGRRGGRVGRVVPEWTDVMGVVLINQKSQSFQNAHGKFFDADIN